MARMIFEPDTRETRLAQAGGDLIRTHEPEWDVRDRCIILYFGPDNAAVGVFGYEEETDFVRVITDMLGGAAAIFEAHGYDADEMIRNARHELRKQKRHHR